MFSIKFVETMAGASLRALCVAALAAIFILFLRRSSPRLKHAVWVTVSVSMLAFPLITLFAPPWLVAGIPQVVRLPFAQENVPQVKSATAIKIDYTNQVMLQPLAVTVPSAPTWAFLTAGAYFVGLLAFVLRLALGLKLSNQLVANSTTLRDSVANRVLKDIASRQSALYPLPEVLESERIHVPCVVGCERPAILLPVEWHGWDDATLEAVLAHELTHVRRGDWHFVILAAVNKCVFWFHPLAWWLERHLAALAEQASDEGALDVTRDPAAYASVLLEVSSAARPLGARPATPVVPMASSNLVARRIHRILDQSVHSSGVLPTRTWTAVVGFAFPLICLLAAAQAPSPQAQAAQVNLSKTWVNDGFKITPQEAMAMEHQLTIAPNNLEIRGKLLSYYLYNANEDGLLRNALWVIQNQPQSDVALHPAVNSPYFAGGHSYLTQMQAAWLQQTVWHSDNPHVLANAANFLRSHDLPQAERLLKRAYELDPNGRWQSELADLYARVLLADSYFGVGANMLPIWIGANRAYTAQIRSELLQSDDIALVGRVGSVLASVLLHSFYSLPDRNSVLEARSTAAADAEALLKKAQSLGPNQPHLLQGLTQLGEARTFRGSS
jgi:beta-lactamase regulating signal transducer with metallopeptidase domain